MIKIWSENFSPSPPGCVGQATALVRMVTNRWQLVSKTAKVTSLSPGLGTLTKRGPIGIVFEEYLIRTCCFKDKDTFTDP